MNLDAILEVAIGLVSAWLTLSVAAMQVQEWFGSAMAWRANFLRKAIGNMLGSNDLLQKFYTHPLITSLSEPGRKPGQFRMPSYIPADKFSAVVMDLLFNAGKETNIQTPGLQSRDQMIASVQGIKQQNAHLGTILDHIFPRLADPNFNFDQVLADAKTNLEDWFNDGMDRLTGWYKRTTSVWAFFVGIFIAVTFNVDSVQIATQLWKAPTVREALIAQATSQAAGAAVPTNNTGIGALLKPQDYANSLAIPFGWSTAPVTDPSLKCGWTPGQDLHPYLWLQNQCDIIVNLPAMDDLWGWMAKILGILISGAAAAQGAPFWFDILKKLVNVRGSGATPPVAPPAPAPVPVVVATPPAAAVPAPPALSPATDGPVG
jgi:hypothetical protein